MKFLVLAVATTLSLSVMAGKHHGSHKEWEKKFDAMSFEDQKKMMTEKLDRKFASIDEAKTCVNGAKDKDALKKCKMEMKEDHREMKKEMMDKMKK